MLLIFILRYRLNIDQIKLITLFLLKILDIYRVAKEIWHHFFYALTSSNTNRFSKLFHCQIRRKFVIILSLKIPPHLKCVATLPCEMSGVLKATIENKTTSVTIHFKKLTTGNNVFIVSVIV